MCRITKIIILIGVICLFSITIPKAAYSIPSEWGYSTFNDQLWVDRAVMEGLPYFHVNIPDSITTLSSGSPLATPLAGKNITFDTDLTRSIVYDVIEDTNLVMFDTDPSTSVTISFNGFQAVGWGFEIFPKYPGIFYFGVEFYDGTGVYTHYDGDASPHFLGYKMGEPFSSITINCILERLYDDEGNLIGSGPSDPFYFGEMVFIEASPIPIPSAVLLLGSGLIGLVGFRKKLKK